MTSFISAAATAALVSAGIALVGSTISAPAACAAPAEFDPADFDACVASALAKYQRGAITLQQYNGSVKDCCWAASGRWDDKKGCIAPPPTKEITTDPTRAVPTGPIHDLTPAP